MAPARVVQLPYGGWDSRILAFEVERLVTVYAVVSTRYVVLIDTLFSPSAVAPVLDALGPAVDAGRRLLVVNTHAHWDHAWGNSFFAGPEPRCSAPIIGHRLGPELLLGEEGRAELARKKAEDPETFGQLRLQPATILIQGETVLDGGDLHFVLVPTPGHEPDHLAVFVPQLSTLFAGDAAEWPLPFVSEPADVPALRGSLRRMQELDPAVVLYAHAPGRTTVDVVRVNQGYFDDLERRIRAAAPLHDPTGVDPEEVLGYPFESVIGVDTLDAEGRAFYRGAHRAAIRAMLDHVHDS